MTNHEKGKDIWVLIRNKVARNGLEIEAEALQLRSSYFALDPLSKVMSRHKLPYAWLDSSGRSGIKVARTENLHDPFFAEMRGHEQPDGHRRMTPRHMSWGRAFRWKEGADSHGGANAARVIRFACLEIPAPRLPKEGHRQVFFLAKI